MINTVFAYGTLKQGHANHRWATEAATPQVCPATLHGFEMFSLGRFPGIRPQAGGKVQGELLTYPEEAMPEVLALMDQLEGYQGPGYSNLYDREQHAVTLPDGQTVPAWVYVYALTPVHIDVIAEGVWARPGLLSTAAVVA